MAIWRLSVDGEVRLATGPAGGGPEFLLEPSHSMDSLLAVGGAWDGLSGETPTDGRETTLSPLESQEVWASGVTYEESRYAREMESTAPDFYREVYFAERPELFLKAVPGTLVDPGGEIGVRVDSDWNVPEPELGLLIAANGTLVALTLGNDVSSRTIEGANPLYLPQAKVYDLSCAVGPCLVPLREAPPIPEIVVEITITRANRVVFEGSSPLSKLKRTPEELISWLMRARSYPNGVLLLTGTGVVPPKEFNLLPDDVVTIRGEGLGELTNRVVSVGQKAHELPQTPTMSS